MKLKSRLKMEKPGMVVSSIFYGIAGGAEFLVLFLSGFRLFPLGILGFLSFAAAYGLIKTKKWSVWLVAILLLLGGTFGATTLRASVMRNTINPNAGVLSFHLMLIAYLVMTAVASIYVLAKRKSLE